MSREKISTTHTGSLPRPPEVLELLRARDDRTLTEDEASEVRDRIVAALAGLLGVEAAIVIGTAIGLAGFALFARSRPATPGPARAAP